MPRRQGFFTLMDPREGETPAEQEGRILLWASRNQQRAGENLEAVYWGARAEDLIEIDPSGGVQRGIAGRAVAHLRARALEIRQRRSLAVPVAPAPSTVPSQQDHGSLHRTLAPVAPLARQEDDSNFGVQTFLAPRTQQHYGPDYPFGQPSQDGHMPLPGHFGSSFVPIHQYQGHPHQQQYQPYHPPSQQQPGQQLPSYGQQNSFGVPEFPYNFEIESGRRAPSRPTGFQRGSFDDASPPRTINRSTTWFDQYGMPDTDSRSRLPSTSAPVGTSQQDPVHSTAGDDRYRMVDEYEDRGSTRGRSHVGAYSQPGTEDASAYRDQHPSGQPSRSQPMYRQSERQIGPAINRAPPPPPPPPSQSRPPRLQLQAPGPFGIPPDPFDTGEESPRFHPSHLPDDSTSATQFWRNARFNVPADYPRDPHANEFLRDLERDADQTAAIAAVVRRVPDAFARILRQFGVTEPPGLNRQTRVAVEDLTRTFSIYMPELHPSDATEPLVRALLHQAGLYRYGEETWLLFVQLCWRRNKSLPPPILMEQIQDIIRIAERNGIRAVLPGSSVQRPRNRTNQGVGGPSQGSQSRRRRQQASSSGATTAGGGDADGPSVVEDDDDIMRQPSSSQATAHDTSSLQTGTALRQGGSALGTHPHSSPSSQSSEQRPRRRPRLSDPSTESSSAFHVSSATTLDGQAHSPVEEDRRDPPELPGVDDSDEDLYEEPTAERALQVNQFLQQHAQQQLAHVGNTFRDAGAMEAATTEEAQGTHEHPYHIDVTPETQDNSDSGQATEEAAQRRLQRENELAARLAARSASESANSPNFIRPDGQISRFQLGYHRTLTPEATTQPTAQDAADAREVDEGAGDAGNNDEIADRGAGDAGQS